MSQKSAKSAAELESMIMAELREHPECDSAGVAIFRPSGIGAALVGEGPHLNDDCRAKLAEIANRLRQEFDLAE